MSPGGSRTSSPVFNRPLRRRPRLLRHRLLWTPQPYHRSRDRSIILWRIREGSSSSIFSASKAVTSSITIGRRRLLCNTSSNLRRLRLLPHPLSGMHPRRTIPLCPLKGEWITPMVFPLRRLRRRMGMAAEAEAAAGCWRGEGEIMQTPPPDVMKATQSLADFPRPDIDRSSSISLVGRYLIRSNSGSTGSGSTPLRRKGASHYRWRTSWTKGRRRRANSCPPTIRA